MQLLNIFSLSYIMSGLRSTQKGGKHRRSASRRRFGGRTRRGGTTWAKGFAKLAVPAGLIWANNLYRTGSTSGIAKRDFGITTSRDRRWRRTRRNRRRRDSRRRRR